MESIYELQRRAAALREKTQVDSVTPEEVGGLQFDTLAYMADMEQNASGLGIRKVYTSTSAMNADKSPFGTNGKPLRLGQLVTVYNKEDATAEGNGNVYAFQKPGWLPVGNILGLSGLSSLVDDTVKKSTEELAVELQSDIDTLKRKMNILYKVALTLSGGKNVEKGTTQTVNLSWTVKVNGSNVNPSAQALNGEVLDTTVRSKQFTGVTSDTTYTLVVDGVTATAHVRFCNPAYFGVVSADYTPDGSVSGLTKLSNYGMKTYTGNTTTAGYNKVVYMYPSSLGTLSSIKDGNNFDLTNSFTRSTVTVNGESYYVYTLTDATDTSKQTFKFS